MRQRVRLTSRLVWLVSGALAAGSGTAAAQTSPIFPADRFHLIRDEASGERPLVDFRNIVTDFSGCSPSRGGDQTAEYIAQRMRQAGLQDVAIDGFPADGHRFVWAFLTQPSWEAESGTLSLVAPRVERLGDFEVDRTVLGRFSSSAEVTTDLIDVGEGTGPDDYAGKDVTGRIVLASGVPGRVHGEAVWRRGAAGVVSYRADPERPWLVSNPAIVPWNGPDGRAPGFVFAISHATAMRLRSDLQRGEHLRVRASVKATSGAGEYKQVTALIPGADPQLPEVWVKAHDDYRNAGGANNLSGVGATMEVARVLQGLIGRGTLPQPRRTIRFIWSAEHYGSVYQFSAHPELLGRALAMLNVDVTGLHQERAEALMRFYRVPRSRPHFVSDAAEELLRSVARANTFSNRNQTPTGMPDPIFAPTGTRHQLHFKVEEFWGPSDHEDVLDGSLGVPAVQFGSVNPLMGTQVDDISLVDPTQMRRSVTIVAATAYYLAAAGPAEVPRLAEVMTAAAEARMVQEAARARVLVEDAGHGALARHYREARNVLRQSLAWESAALASLAALGPVADAVARARLRLERLHDLEMQNLRDLASTLAGARGASLDEPAPPAAEREMGALVPVRREEIRGPVNLFRPEYGALWLAQKTGDDQFLAKVKLAERGRFVPYEALNFADGRRSLQEIRDAVSAEYVPLDLAELEQYFRFLERVGVVSLGPSVEHTDRSSRQ